MAVAKLQDFRCLFGAQVVDVRFARGFGGASAVVLTSFLPMVQQRADALGWTWVRMISCSTYCDEGSISKRATKITKEC